MHVHYAIQTCDIAFNQVNHRYCNTNKATLIKKCVTSFFESVDFCASQDSSFIHHICIIDDHSTSNTIEYLQKLINIYGKKKNIMCSFQELKETGVMESIRATYEWLRDNGIHLVYQVQDDYLFHKHAIREMVYIYKQMEKDCNTKIIVSPWNRAELWLKKSNYLYWASPRTVVVGKWRYWIQFYDISCSFMTHIDILKGQWDLIEIFLKLPPTGLGVEKKLENISLNYMFTKRGILGLMPVSSLALHIQSERDKDPHINWKEWWDNVIDIKDEDEKVIYRF